MPSPCYLNWTQFALELLETRATSALKYLPPSHYCTVEYPLRLKKSGCHAAIYSKLIIPEQPGPLYVLDCTMWDHKQTVLSETSFILPCREPVPSVSAFRGTWDLELEVFVVRQVRGTVASWINLPHNTENMARCRCGTDIGVCTRCENKDTDWTGFGNFKAPPKQSWWPSLYNKPDQEQVEAKGYSICLDRELFNWADEFDNEDTARSPDEAALNHIHDIPKTVSHPDGPITTPLENGELPDISILLQREALDSTNESDDGTNSSGSQSSDILESPPTPATDISESESLLLKPFFFSLESTAHSDLIQREIFDWADESDELTPLQQSQPTSLPLDHLLKREPFDWADKPEEFEARTPSPSPSDPAPPSTQVSESEPSTLPLPSYSGTLFVVSCPPASSEARPYQEDAFGLVSGSESLGPGPECSYLRPDNLFEPVGYETSWQDQLVASTPDLHHINWFGNPVTERSYTPAEVSLYIICSAPKPWTNECSPRATCLRQAMKFVDPVLYQGEYKDLVSENKGLAYIRDVAGCVQQFYTARGSWMQDTSYESKQEMPLCDPADPYAYHTQPWVPVNGYMKALSHVPVRWEYYSLCDESIHAKPRAARTKRLNSPLSRCSFAG
ncbi:hypothetical protein FQN57_007508 [Myotisia sp. PD_48]|nr:hypothetical protein FQN57_007508 [Myotisia sp. PD_48]